MTFRESSNKTGWDDWALACEAVMLRGLASYSDDPEADAARRIGEAFTEDEIRRADAYLAAGVLNTGRLAAIEATLAEAGDDTKWLVEQLRHAWARNTVLRDRIDAAGSLMDIGCVASAIGYVPGSRTVIGA
ncbi:hypothetical protein ACFY30_33945 [Streptomyces sp. NPDC000345]|uniref:hypothetical protein n=1 Tax=Streptomyces sp. NPDC000345 TaxID=3364537 RepID=UPI0036A24C5E